MSAGVCFNDCCCTLFLCQSFSCYSAFPVSCKPACSKAGHIKIAAYMMSTDMGCDDVGGLTDQLKASTSNLPPTASYDSVRILLVSPLLCRHGEVPQRFLPFHKKENKTKRTISSIAEGGYTTFHKSQIREGNSKLGFGRTRLACRRRLPLRAVLSAWPVTRPWRRYERRHFSSSEHIFEESSFARV